MLTPVTVISPALRAPAEQSRVQRRTLLTLVITQVVGTIGVGVAPSIGVLLAGEVTDSETWAGLARTASTLGAAVLGLPLGHLAALHGRRVALATGWWTAAAGGALLVVAAQLNQVVLLFLGLLLMGAGSAVSLQSRFAATDLARPEHKARSLALVVWVGTLGSVLGPNLGVPGGYLGQTLGLTVYAGAFLIAAAALALAGTIVVLALRPDPLLLLREQADGATVTVPPRQGARPRRGRTRRALAEIGTNPRARYALIAILTAQIVMVSIMTMTPVHLAHHGDTIAVIGLTISLHVAGMFAFAPVVGLLVDRAGARPAIGVGLLILLVSLLSSALRPADTGWIVASLILLGVGWSFVNVAGSALLSGSIAPATRAATQGGVDSLANLCGAFAAFLAGPLLAVSSFPTLSVLAIMVMVPLAVLTFGPRRLRDAIA